MSSPNTKETILQAAIDVVIDMGASHMTLDAVAERAGLSKGGLLYNFSTKEALLDALLDHMMAHFSEFREIIRQEHPQDRDNDLVIEIRSLQEKSENERRMSAALLAVIFNQPNLMSKLRMDLHDRFFKKIMSQSNRNRSSILFFASMGILFHDLLNISLLDRQFKQELYEELIRLAKREGNIENWV